MALISEKIKTMIFNSFYDIILIKVRQKETLLHLENIANCQSYDQISLEKSQCYPFGKYSLFFSP